MKARTFRISLLAALLCVFTITSAASAGEPLRIATGGKNGTYCACAQDMAAAAKKKGLDVEVINTSGSMENIKLLKSGDADIAFVQSDVLGFLFQKDKDAGRKFKVLFPLYDEEVHILANDKIKSIKDFEKRRIATGNQKSGSWLTVSTIVFQEAIPSVKKVTDLSPEEAVIALLSGQVDAMVYVAGKPTPLFEKLNKMKKDPKKAKLLDKIHMLPVDDPKLLSAYYHQSKLGPSDYPWMKEEVPTLAVKAYVVRYDPNYDEYDSHTAEKDPQIAQLIQVVKENIGQWKKTGHEKWKQVNIDAPLLPPWERDPFLLNDVQVEDLEKMFE